MGRGRPVGRRGLAVALAALASLAPVPVARADPPLFDAHIHYSAPDREAFTPERILETLDRAGVRRALVSSTPDDGTVALWERAPDRIVPFLRPYRARDDMTSWHRDPEVQRHVEARLARGIYRGIGEFHLYGADVEGPVVRRVAELAREHHLFLHAHTDETTLGRMLDLFPEVRILWAHAGMSAGPPGIARLLARSPRLWVELSLRNGDIAPGGRLDPAWRELFLAHPDRFLVGTDTWVVSRWHEIEAIHRETRGWLLQLPREVAERIASGNGDRLFPAR